MDFLAPSPRGENSDSVKLSPFHPLGLGLPWFLTTEVKFGLPPSIFTACEYEGISPVLHSTANTGFQPSIFTT